MRKNSNTAQLMKEELSRLGFRIRRKRILLGYSQNVFAAKCGLDRSYLGEIERGDRDITFGVLCTICEGLTSDIAAMTKHVPFTVDPHAPLRTEPVLEPRLRGWG